tara:strand:- start:1044 stop:2318 length:1275 start_codon:yes stop_codon:yes gene_type:complete
MENKNSPTQDKYAPDFVVDVDGSDRWDVPRILSPPVTIALGIFGFAVASIFIWSVTYRLPVYSKGNGLIYSGERLYGVRAQSDGIVKSVNISVESLVQKGDELANLYIDDHEAKQKAANTEYESSVQNRVLADVLIPSELASQIASNEKLLSDTRSNIEKQNIVLKKQKNNLKTYAKLESKGYLSAVELLKYQQQAIELENTIGKTESTLIGLKATRDKTIRELNQSLNDVRSKMASDKATLTIRKNALSSSRKLFSPITGKVVQSSALKGNTVSKGEELFVVTYPKRKLRGAFLLNSKSGGEVRVGEEVLISPSSAPAQRYGYLMGRVEKVSPYPTNKQAFSSFIGSDSLSKMVFESQKLEAPTLVIVGIDYKDGHLNWIGSRGPEWGIRSGTIASAKILYERRLPISYVIPWLSKLTGLENF